MSQQRLRGSVSRRRGGRRCSHQTCTSAAAVAAARRTQRVHDASQGEDEGEDVVWNSILEEAKHSADNEPLLSSFLHASVVSHRTFASSLAFVLANLLADETLHATQLIELFHRTLHECPSLVHEALEDIRAMYSRNPACTSYAHCLLYFKGFHAIETHRISHEMWNRGQKFLAFALQSRMSQVFGVDIHPGARLGSAILLDHGNGVVMGETAVVGDRVSILHGVTLGGTGKESGDRHPKVGDGVLIGAHATVLGNIHIGEGAKIAAGSLVLKDVKAHTIAAGTPAEYIGDNPDSMPSLSMSQSIQSSDDGTPTIDMEEDNSDMIQQDHQVENEKEHANASSTSRQGNGAPNDEDSGDWWAGDRPKMAYEI